MTVVTRFAPSPTGFLHIGGARTALFNWLFAKHNNGKFLLRIEDTDRKRSSNEAVEAIYHGMKWLGLDWDGEAISQFERASRHAEVAKQLLSDGKAYKCYCSPEELTEMRELAKKEKRPIKYDGTWRDKSPAEAPPGVPPVIRFKAPTEGKTTITDAVQGDVTVANAQLDDMVLLRADGTPTYMLAVVVDDYDMGVTHAIRGDDHLNNAFRQIQIYKAMGWEPPIYAHIPLIHGSDGAKLSKRHGALGVEAYEEMGFLPEAMRNYLVRLGWSHGDAEIFSTEQAIEWFGLDGIGKAAARFDTVKLTALNGNYIKEAQNERLASLIIERLNTNSEIKLSEHAEKRLKQGMQGLKERAKTLVELAENAQFYAVETPLAYTPKALKLLDTEGREKISGLLAKIEQVESWESDALEVIVKAYAEEKEYKLGKVAQPLRAALSGTTVTPGIFEVMEVLGREESLKRIAAALQLTDA